jgi:Tfp pilus assembly protein PilO
MLLAPCYYKFMYVLDDETRRFGRVLHYVGVLATVVCATVMYSLLHAPTADAVASTSMKIEELTLSVQNAPMIRQQHRSVGETLRDVKKRIASVQQRVPRDADAGAFLKEVTELATAEQLAFKDFQPEKPTNKDGFAEMQVTLKGQGTYASVCTFLHRLSSLKRLSKVKDLTLSAGEGAAEYPMTATLVIYFGLRGRETTPSEEDRRG